MSVRHKPATCFLPQNLHSEHDYYLATMFANTLSINCFVLGVDSSEVFTVEVLKTKNVSILKGLIKEKHSRRLNHVDASELTAWKVSVPFDKYFWEKGKVLDLKTERPLLGLTKLA